MRILAPPDNVPPLLAAPFKRWIIRTAPLGLMVAAATATDLYLQDFESFQTGFDTLVGTDGWQGNAQGMQIHGVADVSNAFLGQSAFIGPNLPTADSGLTFVYAERPVGYDPVANGTPVVVVSIILGISDPNSPDIRRDNFFVTFLNSLGEVLGRVNFDNSDTSFGIYRVQGNTATFTGFDFVRNELHELSCQIDFATNTWTATLDGFPLFAHAPFADPGVTTLDLGTLAFDWQITHQEGSIDPSGKNWLLFDDLITAVPTPPFQLVPTPHSPCIPPTIQFFAEPGHSYQILHSEHLTTWSDTLPDSTFTPQDLPALTTFTDPTPTPPAQRLYKLHRTEAVPEE
ncbi:hypothetical protein BH23VER1_BH23VER1_02370 [soil metagenome]